MDKEIEIQGTRIHYTDTGSGDRPVILMHGWGCNATTVESIRAIAAQSHRVITVDFPGHGESGEPPLLSDGTPWGVDAFTRAIEELSRREGITDPILIGHSFGGRVAILYASRNATHQVVLVDAAGIKPRRSWHYYRRVYTFKMAKWCALTFLGEKRGGKVVEKMRARRGSSDYRQSSAMMRSVMSRVVNEDLRHVMPLIKAPTLLIWGEMDTATPLNDARIMEKLIPDAGLVSFTGCGHYSFLDNPGAFKAVLSNFINS